jgi:hypothetical protein
MAQFLELNELESKQLIQPQQSNFLDSNSKPFYQLELMDSHPKAIL